MPDRKAGRPRAEDDPALRRRNLCIFALRHAEGLPVATIARAYGLSERQVRKILARAPRPGARLHSPPEDPEDPDDGHHRYPDPG